MTLAFSAPRPERAGPLVMVAAMAIVPMIDVLAKMLVLDGMSALQVVFLRMALGALIILPFALRMPRTGPRLRGGWTAAFLMGGLNVAAAACFFSALYYLSIADTVAISFVQPIFITLVSCLVLRERVSPLRWMAILVGFLAALIIIRPGFNELNPGSFLALGSGFSMACYAIVVRHSSMGGSPASPFALTWYTHLTGMICAAPLMLFLWVMPNAEQWLLLLGLTLIGLVGQYLIVTAYRLSEASLVAPFAYFEIVTSIFVSWLFFRQVPDLITLFGVMLLMCSSLMILRKG